MRIVSNLHILFGSTQSGKLKPLGHPEKTRKNRNNIALLIFKAERTSNKNAHFGYRIYRLAK
ncbi:hypothetical protein BES34_015505 [Leptospira inadai serovar Lyme]|uniref:Uncharacterized protein n=1 Tax=Leptospira inadai serovar Lyme TaxID=293084 RepID=A0ABX4YFS3_9LEPT|nr:hypothetical protein BES34_015505 [Leptospira inadai serovar Lyme]